MELCCPIPDIDERGSPPASIRAARDVQCASVDGPGRSLPTNFPPWELVYQQTQRWLNAGCFEAMVNDLRSVLRVARERQSQPSAVILDGRTLQSTCESGPRAGYDGYKRKRGSKVHIAVDTLGYLLAVHITAGQ